MSVVTLAELLYEAREDLNGAVLEGGLTPAQECLVDCLEKLHRAVKAIAEAQRCWNLMVDDS